VAWKATVDEIPVDALKMIKNFIFEVVLIFFILGDDLPPRSPYGIAGPTSKFSASKLSIVGIVASRPFLLIGVMSGGSQLVLTSM
jgi:hypothetical protein